MADIENDSTLPTGDRGATSKVDMVGSNETVQAVNVLTLKIEEYHVEIASFRRYLIVRNNRMELLSKFTMKIQDEITKSLELMKSYNLRGNTDRQLWDRINRAFEIDQKTEAKYIDEFAELEAEQQKQLYELANLCMTRSVEASELFPPVVFAMREELNLPIDREAYLASHSSYVSGTRKLISSILDPSS